MSEFEKGCPGLTDETREKWVAALRSGEYVQGRNQLRDLRPPKAGWTTRGFCCLGVLVDATHPELWVEDDRAHEKGRFGLLDSQNGIDGMQFCTLTNQLSDALGLSSSDINDCIFANDAKTWSFERIADWLEGKNRGPRHVTA